MVDMSSDEIDALLGEAHIGRLSMADREGWPYVIPLPFCWANGTVYLRLPLTGRKGRILADNDRVCFEVDSYTDRFDEYASVLVEGRLVAVIDLEEKTRLKDLNDCKYNRLRRGHRPGHGRANPLCKLPLRKILVEQVSGRRKEPDLASSLSARGNSS